jgi:hypothetical protein
MPPKGTHVVKKETPGEFYASQEMPVEVPPVEKKTKLIKVRSMTDYTNGTIEECPRWRLGEVKQITVEALGKLRTDLPDNWEIL